MSGVIPKWANDKAGQVLGLFSPGDTVRIDRALLHGAFAAALVQERERCAKIAEDDWEIAGGYIAAAIREDVKMSEVKVKALKWVDGEAETIFGVYQIGVWNTIKDEWKWRTPEVRDTWTISAVINEKWKDTLTRDEAKAAAQADYEARIRSALE